jgi:hypothetical protein
MVEYSETSRWYITVKLLADRNVLCRHRHCSENLQYVTGGCYCAADSADTWHVELQAVTVMLIHDMLSCMPPTDGSAGWLSMYWRREAQKAPLIGERQSEFEKMHSYCSARFPCRGVQSCGCRDPHTRVSKAALAGVPMQGCPKLQLPGSPCRGVQSWDSRDPHARVSKAALSGFPMQECPKLR